MVREMPFEKRTMLTLHHPAAYSQNLKTLLLVAAAA